MKWKVVFAVLFTESARIQSINFPIDRNNPCIVCQTPAEITLKGVKAKNRVNLLPFFFGGLSGERLSTDSTTENQQETLVLADCLI